MGYTEFDLGKTWFYWVLLGLSRFDLVLQGFTWLYWVLVSLTLV